MEVFPADRYMVLYIWIVKCQELYVEVDYIFVLSSETWFGTVKGTHCVSSVFHFLQVFEISSCVGTSSHQLQNWHHETLWDYNTKKMTATWVPFLLPKKCIHAELVWKKPSLSEKQNGYLLYRLQKLAISSSNVTAIYWSVSLTEWGALTFRGHRATLFKMTDAVIRFLSSQLGLTKLAAEIKFYWMSMITRNNDV